MLQVKKNKKDKQYKNILVTGGCGFIGSHLVDRLVSEGFNVFVIDNLLTGLKENINKKASYYFNDINDYVNNNESFRELVLDNKINTVFHLAACTDVRDSLDNPLNVYKTNLLSSISIINICNRAGVEKFIFASTSAVYGEPKYLPVDEDHPTIPISPYGLSKLGFEQYLEYSNIRNNISFFIFRLPNVYGPRQRSDLEGGVVAIFHESMKINKRIIFFGDGKQTRDWVHVYDIVNAFIKSLNYKLKSGVFTLGSGEKTRLIDLFNFMKESYPYKKEQVFKEFRDGDIKHMVMSGKKAQKILNWKAEINLKKGINLIMREQS